MGFPGGSDSKKSACSAGDPGSIPGLGRSLEKEMATHSNILAWRISWIEKPGKLQSMGSQRVGQAEWLSLSLMKYLMCWASYLPLLPPSVLTSFLQLLWCPISAAFQCAQYAEFQSLCFPGGFAQWKHQKQIRQEEEGEVGAHIHWSPHSYSSHPHVDYSVSVHLPMKKTATRWPLVHRDPHFLILILYAHRSQWLQGC